MAQGGGDAQLIRIDELWLAAELIDMGASAERLRARAVQVFGSAQAHHRYLVANTRASRIKKVPKYDGFASDAPRCG